MSDVRLDNAPALLAQVAAGEVTLAEVASAVRLAADGARELNTFIDPDLPGLEDRAAACQPGPLHGLPVVAKDIFDTADQPTSGGTRAHSPRLDFQARFGVINRPLQDFQRVDGGVFGNELIQSAIHNALRHALVALLHDGIDQARYQRTIKLGILGDGPTDCSTTSRHVFVKT